MASGRSQGSRRSRPVSKATSTRRRARRSTRNAKASLPRSNSSSSDDTKDLNATVRSAPADEAWSNGLEQKQVEHIKNIATAHQCLTTWYLVWESLDEDRFPVLGKGSSQPPFTQQEITILDVSLWPCISKDKAQSARYEDEEDDQAQTFHRQDLQLANIVDEKGSHNPLVKDLNLVWRHNCQYVAQITATSHPSERGMWYTIPLPASPFGTLKHYLDGWKATRRLVPEVMLYYIFHSILRAVAFFHEGANSRQKRSPTPLILGSISLHSVLICLAADPSSDSLRMTPPSVYLTDMSGIQSKANFEPRGAALSNGKDGPLISTFAEAKRFDVAQAAECMHELAHQRNYRESDSGDLECACKRNFRTAEFEALLRDTVEVTQPATTLATRSWTLLERALSDKKVKGKSMPKVRERLERNVPRDASVWNVIQGASDEELSEDPTSVVWRASHHRSIPSEPNGVADGSQDASTEDEDEIEEEEDDDDVEMEDATDSYATDDEVEEEVDDAMEDEDDTLMEDEDEEEDQETLSDVPDDTTDEVEQNTVTKPTAPQTSTLPDDSVDDEPDGEGEYVSETEEPIHNQPIPPHHTSRGIPMPDHSSQSVALNVNTGHASSLRHGANTSSILASQRATMSNHGHWGMPASDRLTQRASTAANAGAISSRGQTLSRQQSPFQGFSSSQQPKMRRSQRQAAPPSTIKSPSALSGQLGPYGGQQSFSFLQNQPVDVNTNWPATQQTTLDQRIAQSNATTQPREQLAARAYGVQGAYGTSSLGSHTGNGQVGWTGTVPHMPQQRPSFSQSLQIMQNMGVSQGRNINMGNYTANTMSRHPQQQNLAYHPSQYHQHQPPLSTYELLWQTANSPSGTFGYGIQQTPLSYDVNEYIARNYGPTTTQPLQPRSREENVAELMAQGIPVHHIMMSDSPPRNARNRPGSGY